jgi:hypothetical protein
MEGDRRAEVAFDAGSEGGEESRWLMAGPRFERFPSSPWDEVPRGRRSMRIRSE